MGVIPLHCPGILKVTCYWYHAVRLPDSFCAINWLNWKKCETNLFLGRIALCKFQSHRVQVLLLSRGSQRYRFIYYKYFEIKLSFFRLFFKYCNFPKFSDGQIWANSADPDQTAPRGAVWSGSTLFAIPSASFGCITRRNSHLVQLLGWLQINFQVSEILGFLRYWSIKS